jgi:hypothetical protein
MPPGLVRTRATGGNRTRDAQFRKLPLYPLSYGGVGRESPPGRSAQIRTNVTAPKYCSGMISTLLPGRGAWITMPLPA